MSSDWQKDVIDFHRKYSCHLGDKPNSPAASPKEMELRLDLIHEEMIELKEAVEDGYLPDEAKEIVDLLYIVIAHAVARGILIQPIWDAVHKTNMKKTPGVLSDKGKVLKPKGWKPPDIKKELIRQGWEDEPKN